MKKFFLYGHNGSGNHGCEAIVRSTCKILREGFGDVDITLASGNTSEDREYGLDKVTGLVNEQNPVSKISMPYINAYLNLKLKKMKLSLIMIFVYNLLFISAFFFLQKLINQSHSKYLIQILKFESLIALFLAFYIIFKLIKKIKL